MSALEHAGKVRPGDRAEEILDAARAIFMECGYHNARIEDIARAAGVAKGTVYLYFPGKKELFQALIERMTDAHLDKVRRSLEGPHPLKERLAATARAHLEILASGSDIAVMNAHEVLFSDESFRRKLLQNRSRYIELLEKALSASPGPGATPTSCREAAIAFTGLVHAFHIEIMENQAIGDTAALSKRLASLFMGGFARS